MLTLGSAALAGAGAAVLMVMVVMVVLMVVIVVMMVVVMVMMVTGKMIVMNVHRETLLFLIYMIISINPRSVKTFLLAANPPVGLAQNGGSVYNGGTFIREGAAAMSGFHDHDHEHMHLHAHGLAHSHGHVHENQKAVVNRLARAIGHLEKVKRMVEEGCDCSEVLIQLAAVRSALDNTGKVILKDHMRHCMVDAVAAGDQSAIDDLCQAIDKFMK